MPAEQAQKNQSSMGALHCWRLSERSPSAKRGTCQAVLVTIGISDCVSSFGLDPQGQYQYEKPDMDTSTTITAKLAWSSIGSFTWLTARVLKWI